MASLSPVMCLRHDFSARKQHEHQEPHVNTTRARRSSIDIVTVGLSGGRFSRGEKVLVWE